MVADHDKAVCLEQGSYTGRLNALAGLIDDAAVEKFTPEEGVAQAEDCGEDKS